MTIYNVQCMYHLRQRKVLLLRLILSLQSLITITAYDVGLKFRVSG